MRTNSRLAVVALLALSGCAPTPNSSPGGDASCRDFDGDRVSSVAWNGAGSLLGVLLLDGDRRTSVRVLSWPGLVEQSSIETGPSGDSTVSMDDEGTVYWLLRESNSNTTATLRRKLLSGPDELVGVVAEPILGLVWGGGLVAIVPGETGQRLVRLDLDNPPAPGVAITPAATNAAEFWIDRSGQAMLWIERVDAGAPETLVTQVDGAQTRSLLPTFVGRPSLTADRDIALFRRVDTGTLGLWGVARSEDLGDLDPRDFLVGEISAGSILAAATWSAPGNANLLCVFDVADRLDDLT